MAALRRALLLVNPKARRGAEALAQVPRLQAGGLDVTVENFAAPDELEADIARRAQGMDLIIVCGGDGTVNTAANAIMRAGLPMGLLPLGTANDLARTLDIPADPQGAADIIIAGRTRAIDVGEVNGHPFFNVASIGVSAALARNLSRETKRRWGRLGYALVGLRTLLTARPFGARITGDDGTVVTRTMQIAIGNGRHYGGGSIVHADASITDARLDFYSLERGSLWKLVLLFGMFRSGRHGLWDEVRTGRGTAFTVETRRPRSVNADGELLTKTPARFVVRPKAITVFVP